MRSAILWNDLNGRLRRVHLAGLYVPITSLPCFTAALQKKKNQAGRRWHRRHHLEHNIKQFMFLYWNWPVVWSLPGPVRYDNVPPLSLVQSKMSSVSCVQVHRSFSKLHLSLYLAQVAGSSSLSSPQSSEKSQTFKFNFELNKAAFNVYVLLQLGFIHNMQVVRCAKLCGVCPL